MAIKLYVNGNFWQTKEITELIQKGSIYYCPIHNSSTKLAKFREMGHNRFELYDPNILICENGLEEIIRTSEIIKEKPIIPIKSRFEILDL